MSATSNTDDPTSRWGLGRLGRVGRKRRRFPSSGPLDPRNGTKSSPTEMDRISAEKRWTPRVILSLLTSLTECGILGGAIFGWASLVYVFQHEGFYYDLCHGESHETEPRLVSNTTTWAAGPTTANFSFPSNASLNLSNLDEQGTCLSQKLRLSLGYTIGMACFGLFSFPSGRLFDKYGLQVTRTVNVGTGLTAYILLAVASPKGFPILIFPGAAMLGISCSLLILTTMHVARLARNRVSTVISLYAGALSTAGTFQVVKLAYDYGFSRTYGMLVVASVWFLVLFSTWVLLPKYKIVSSSISTPTRNEQPGKPPVMVISAALPKTTAPEMEGPKDIQPVSVDQQEGGLRACMLSPLYICFLYWFVSLHVKVHMFTNSYITWVTEVVHGDLDKVSFFTDILAYASLLGLIVSPFTGITIDYFRNRHRGSRDKADRAIAAVPALLLSSTALTGLSVSVLFDHQGAVYSAIIFSVLSRNTLYATAISMLGLAFPVAHFGSLFGLMYLLGGIGSLTMYGYFKWAASSPRGFYPCDILLLVTVLLSYGFPAMIFIRTRTRRVVPRIVSITHI